MPTIPSPHFCSLPDAARQIGCSPRLLKDLQHRGIFPKPCTTTGYRQAVIDAWIKEKGQEYIKAVQAEISNGTYYSLRDVLLITKASQPTLKKWIQDGWFPQRIWPGRNLWERAEVDAWHRDRQAGYPVMKPTWIPAFRQQHLEWLKKNQDIADVPYEWTAKKKRPLSDEVTIESPAPHPGPALGIPPAEPQAAETVCENCLAPKRKQKTLCSTCEFLKAHGHQKKFDQRTKKPLAQESSEE